MLLLMLAGMRLSIAVAKAITDPLNRVRQRATLEEVQSHFPVEAKYIEGVDLHAP
jgi:hypothetical protein